MTTHKWTYVAEVIGVEVTFKVEINELINERKQEAKDWELK